VVRKWIVAGAVIVGAFGLAGCSSPGSPSNRSSASTSASSGQVATCEKYLSVSQAEQYTGATSFHVSAQTGFDWSDFPSRPTAQCIYNDVGGIGGSVVPDLSKSPVLWLWLNQSDASQVYKSLASGYPYYRYTYSPLADVGRRASTFEGSVIVQVSSNDTIYVGLGQNSLSTSTAIAKMIAQEILPASSGGSPTTTTPIPPTTTTSTTTSSGNGGGGNSNTTVPPSGGTTGNSGSLASGWLEQNQGTIQTLNNDINSEASASGISIGEGPNLPAFLSACTQLQSDVQTAETNVAPPPMSVANDVANEDWGSGLANLKIGATDCVNGINANDSTLYDQAEQEIAGAARQLDAAVSLAGGDG
jgi:hypothetical protein